MWVPSHVGIPGNDKADEMANVASTGSKINITYKVSKLPTADLLHEVKKQIIKT